MRYCKFSFGAGDRSVRQGIGWLQHWLRPEAWIKFNYDVIKISLHMYMYRLRWWCEFGDYKTANACMKYCNICCTVTPLLTPTVNTYELLPSKKRMTRVSCLVGSMGGWWIGRRVDKLFGRLDGYWKGLIDLLAGILIFGFLVRQIILQLIDSLLWWLIGQ
jgi:hypothetical protein